MKIVGLTGSIGTGKSFIASKFASYGASVFDADAEVHKMMSIDGVAVIKVSEMFPEALENGSINRNKLANIVFENKEELKKLEEIIYPILTEIREKFLKNCFRKGKKIAIMDIPLLFETGLDKQCDIVVVASSPLFIQKDRVVRRINMTEKRFLKINEIQKASFEKEKLADYVVKTGLGNRFVLLQVLNIINDLIKGK